MGAGFCNLTSLKWLTGKPLTPNRLYEQKMKQSQLQHRVQAKAATLLIKVKAHRCCPLNEEADIRAEMGRRI
jgi:hypothetical protein